MSTPHLTCWKCRQLKPVDQFKKSTCGKYPTDLCLSCVTPTANFATVVKDEALGDERFEWRFRNYAQPDKNETSFIRTIFAKGKL